MYPPFDQTPIRNRRTAVARRLPVGSGKVRFRLTSGKTAASPSITRPNRPSASGGRQGWNPRCRGLVPEVSPTFLRHRTTITKRTRAVHRRRDRGHKKRDHEGQAAQKGTGPGDGQGFGLPGLDDESNWAFAAKLTKYEGCRSVTYRGKGVFDVDYHVGGRATQDFVFPAFPDNNLIVPFVAIRRRADGSVLVTAPS